jgi:hypothetical protein
MHPVTEPARDADALIERVRASVIGDDEAVVGPFAAPGDLRTTRPAGGR